MTQKIELTSQEIAAMICKQLIAEGFRINKMDVDWNAELYGTHLILTGATITIKEQEN